MFLFNKIRRPGRADLRRQARPGRVSAASYTTTKPDATRPHNLDRQAKAAARARLKPDSDRYLPGQHAVRLHEQAGVAGQTETALAYVKDRAREVMETEAELTAAESGVDDAQTAAADEELADRQTTAETALANARRAQEQLEAQAPVEPEPTTPRDATPVQPKSEQAEPATAASKRYSSPLGWLALLEWPVLYIVGRGEFGFTRLASKVTLMPSVDLGDFTRALVVATLAGGVFSGRWFRWRAANRGDERIERRWHFLAPAVGLISGALVTVATARMRDAYVRSNYLMAEGSHQFTMQPNFLPWLTVLGLALAGLAFGLSYICASSPIYHRDVWQHLVAWFTQSRSARTERRAAQRTRRQAEQARGDRLAASRQGVLDAEAAVEEVEAARASLKRAVQDAKELVNECWKRLAGLVPELLFALQAVETAIQAQVASGNATSRAFAQRLVEENARRERGAPDRLHDLWRGIKPTTPELKDPPPVIEDASPDKAMAQAWAIAAPAIRVLVKRGLLHPDDLSGLAGESFRNVDVSANGHVPNPPPSIATEEGAS